MREPPAFEIRYEAVDATYGGLFGGRPDANRKMVRGIGHFYVNGREVPKAEYERLWKQHAHRLTTRSAR